MLKEWEDVTMKEHGVAPTTGTGRKPSNGEKYDGCVLDHDDRLITVENG